MQRSTLAKRYAPLAAVVAIQLLIIAVAPSKAPSATDLATSGVPGAASGDPSQVGVEGVVGLNEEGVAIDPATGAPVAGGGGGTAGGTAGGAAGGAGGAAGGATGAVAAGDTSHCVDGLQVDPKLFHYAPKCAPKFTGDNGGATYMGVTKDTIKIIKYEGKPNPAVDAILDSLGSNPPNEEVNRVMQGAAKFINDKYETYGRKVEFKQVDGTCDTVPPDYVCLRNEMRRIVQSEKPFAVLWLTTVASPAFDELSAQKVINMGGYHFRDTFNIQRKPYHWDQFMGGTQLAKLAGEWWCKRMWGNGTAKARYAGKTGTGEGQNPPNNDIRNKNRVLGVISTDDPENKNTIEDLKAELAKCGAKVEHEYYYAQDIARAEEQRRLGVARMREAPEATSIMFFGDAVAPVFLYRTCEEQKYYPEQVFVGSSLMDTDRATQEYDGTLNPGGRQMDNAFGIGTQPEVRGANQSMPGRILKAVGDNKPIPDNYATAENDMGYFLTIGQMIQAAGPNLTPANVERGMFAQPGRGGATQGIVDLFLNGRSWKPNDYTAVDDVREIYFSKKKTSAFNGKVGAWVDVHNGKRFLPGQFPSGLLEIPDSPR